MSAIPEDFICPISRQIMTAPISLPCQHKVDKGNIEIWFKYTKNTTSTCPLCTAKFFSKNIALVVDERLAIRIRAFVNANFHLFFQDQNHEEPFERLKKQREVEAEELIQTMLQKRGDEKEFWNKNQIRRNIISDATCEKLFYQSFFTNDLRTAEKVVNNMELTSSKRHYYERLISKYAEKKQWLEILKLLERMENLVNQLPDDGEDKVRWQKFIIEDYIEFTRVAMRDPTFQNMLYIRIILGKAIQLVKSIEEASRCYVSSMSELKRKLLYLWIKATFKTYRKFFIFNSVLVLGILGYLIVPFIREKKNRT